MTFAPSPEQKAIIDHPALPLRIAAGAGTGKTTTIVLRLAKLVADGADPARSLGITFTNKAADELRIRLRATIGVRTDGREVEVATYHSFAASILDEFGSRIGFRAGATLMDEGHRSELATRVLRRMDRTSLDLTALSHRRDDVLSLAGSLSDNLLVPDDVRAAAPSDIDETWETRLALLDAVDAYQDAKAHLGLIEYSDLMRYAVRIVTDHTEVAEEVRSRYDSVLLDEYQDTDPAQRRLLTAIFRAHVPVTAVGDTDQTIYEWRGASIENFEAFPVDFPTDRNRPAETLLLSVNRRSDSLILDLANRIRSEISDRARDARGLGDLVPAHGSGRGEVLTAWLRTDREEAEWIAQEIQASHAAGRGFRDIAVLCRKRDGLRPIADALRAADIPFSIGSMGELLDVPEIADLVAWLSILATPDDESALTRILLGGRYRLGLADLAIASRATSAPRHITLLDVILDGRSSVDLDERANSALRSFASTYARLYRDSQAMTVAATLEAVIDALDYWSEVAAMSREHATTTRINVGRFMDLADRWRPLDGHPTVAAFLRYLRALNESGRADELDAADVQSEDAVALLTAHGAKGLEWDEVFVPSLSTNIFPSGVLRYYDPINTPTAVPYGLRLDAEPMAEVDALADIDDRRALLRARHDDQEWRLAYVAATRARRRLVMSGHAWHADNKNPRTPSALLGLAGSMDGVITGPFVDDPGERPQLTPHAPAESAPDPLFEHGWGAAVRSELSEPGWISKNFPDFHDDIDRRVRQMSLEFADLRDPHASAPSQRFSTSVTNLVALAECPQKFAWIHHDRLPRRPRRSAILGTEFHRRVELHNLGVVPLEDSLSAEYDAIAEDEEHTVGGTGSAPADPWATFAASRFHDERPVMVETPFEIELGGRSVRGKVDAVYETEDGWEIVDYKSGSPGSSDAKRVQLQAYAVAAAEGAITTDPPEHIDVTFAYFGTSPASEETEHADERWLSSAHTRVAGLLETAEVGPFDPTPSPACRWCDFLHHCEAGTRFMSGAAT